jgi:hypothetical protein
MAQAVRPCPLTAKAGFASVLVHVGSVVEKLAQGQVFSRVLRFSPVTIIPPLLHIHLSPPHEVCNSPDQPGHYHTVGPTIGASSLAQHLAGTEEKNIVFYYILYVSLF